MIKKLKSILKRLNRSFEVLLYPQKNFVYPTVYYSHHNLSFSQEGEDMILSRIFEQKQKGFYVDIGAHHPQRFSNTYYFYLRGWRGINIDAMPGSMKSFKDLRPEDLNLEIPISNEEKTLTFYVYNEPALNTFSREVIERRSTAQDFKSRFWITHKLKLKTVTLAEIFERYLTKNQDIDFMSIDVEGLDHDVLTSNDWSKYRPKVVIVEDVGSTLMQIHENSPVSSFMSQVGYSLYAKTVNSLFFRINTNAP